MNFQMKRGQLKLFKRSWLKHEAAFGGSLLKGSNPKKKRTFKNTLPLHIVLRSEHAKGKNSLLKWNKEIDSILELFAQRQGIRIYGAANAGNHLHLVVQAPSRDRLSNFLRAISGRIAQLVLEKAEFDQVKGHRVVNAGSEQKDLDGANIKMRFWDARPWSRLVTWGREFNSVLRYLGINSTETLPGMSRNGTRQMFNDIHAALKLGHLRCIPSLVAAGFG